MFILLKKFFIFLNYTNYTDGILETFFFFFLRLELHKFVIQTKKKNLAIRELILELTITFFFFFYYFLQQ